MTTTADHLLHAWTTHLQSLRLWVMQLVAWLAAVSGSREMRLMAQEDLRHLRRDVRFMLVTRLAIAMQAGTLAPPHYRNSRKTPAIDHALPHRRFNRCALRGIRLKTLGDAKRVLENIDVYVARIARNLRHGVKERVLHWCVRALSSVRVVVAVVRAPDT